MFIIIVIHFILGVVHGIVGIVHTGGNVAILVIVIVVEIIRIHHSALILVRKRGRTNRRPHGAVAIRVSVVLFRRAVVLVVLFSPFVFLKQKRQRGFHLHVFIFHLTTTTFGGFDVLLSFFASSTIRRRFRRIVLLILLRLR